MNDRYPYTYAADFIRNYSDITSKGISLSRAGASQIRGAISKALGIPDEELAKKLADYYLAHQDEEARAAAEKMLCALGFCHNSKFP